MSTIIPKSQMTEEDIKLNFITPALIAACWQNKITMETKDDPNTITSHEVFFSLYQQLTDREDEKDKDDTVSRLTQLFNPYSFSFKSRFPLA